MGLLSDTVLSPCHDRIVLIIHCYCNNSLKKLDLVPENLTLLHENNKGTGQPVYLRRL